MFKNKVIFLIVKDQSTCNWTRDYKAATVYVTAPNIIEIHSKTEQDIRSEGILTFGILDYFQLMKEEKQVRAIFIFH